MPTTETYSGCTMCCPDALVCGGCAAVPASWTVEFHPVGRQPSYAPYWTYEQLPLTRITSAPSGVCWWGRTFYATQFINPPGRTARLVGPFRYDVLLAIPFTVGSSPGQALNYPVGVQIVNFAWDNFLGRSVTGATWWYGASSLSCLGNNAVPRLAASVQLSEFDKIFDSALYGTVYVPTPDFAVIYPYSGGVSN